MTAAVRRRKSLGEFADGLKRDGYSMNSGALLPGKSGVVHRFDLLAEKTEGGKRKTVVCMKERGHNPVEEMVGLFAMAFDVDAEPCYAVRGSVDEGFAESYRITLVENE
ncbi:MAG: hypothetical protein JRN12_06225 [Nitrososphaerota archaeon]|nr:hypothetical protein [Nitrososphaerota archaeon]MDG6954639.1 hypothetical protein [Nitrososphaerota archaeon]